VTRRPRIEDLTMFALPSQSALSPGGREAGTRTWAPVTFYALPTGERCPHFGLRATPKA
jgi:hypothetical protein